MNRITKIIIFMMIFLFTMYILLNEINEYNLRKLKEETLKISQILQNKYDTLTQININSDEEIEGITTRGVGKAFIDGQNATVILSYNDYCSVKIPGIEEVSLSKTKCHNLELIKNVIIPITDKNGLVKENNNYYYKGKDVDNYIIFNNEYWRILGFENNRIKLIKDEPINKIKSYYLMEYLNLEYYSQIKDKDMIELTDYDISEIDINEKIVKVSERKVNSNVSILSLEEYLNTLNDKCTIKNSNLLCSESFASYHMWINNKKDIYNYYIYTDGNVYYQNYDEEKNIYPVVTLKETVEIISGYGTKEDPYKLK